MTAWLVCHLLAWSALLPRNCCAAHAHAGVASSGCHESAVATAGDHCAMPAGAACPMHDGAAPAPDTCRLAGVCNAPAAALAVVLMQSGTPPGPVALATVSATPADVLMASADRLVSHVPPPDPPPPRV